MNKDSNDDVTWMKSYVPRTRDCRSSRPEPWTAVDTLLTSSSRSASSEIDLLSDSDDRKLRMSHSSSVTITIILIRSTSCSKINFTSASGSWTVQNIVDQFKRNGRASRTYWLAWLVKAWQGILVRTYLAWPSTTENYHQVIQQLWVDFRDCMMMQIV